MASIDILSALIIASGIIIKKKYNINNREYYDLLKILKKYKYLLIKIYFIIEFNAKILVI